MPKRNTISVVIQLYKRPQALKPQLDAIFNQTVKPKEIIVCINGNKRFDEQLLKHPYIKTIRCSKNLGVWGRYSFALNCVGDYIAIFDDDCIPGKRWFESCLNTMEKQEGLLGCEGTRFLSRNKYLYRKRFGWIKPNDETIEVDILRHCWFMKKEWLPVFFREPRPNRVIHTVGENIHLSYSLQKYLNIKTFVPPHPKDEPELWGCKRYEGVKYGSDLNSITLELNSWLFVTIAYKIYLSKGFQLYYDKVENPFKNLLNR